MVAWRNRALFEACTRCGERFESGIRYPVETRVETDGARELYSFCDDACRSAWWDGRVAARSRE